MLRALNFNQNELYQRCFNYWRKMRMVLKQRAVSNKYTINVFICGILPRNYISSINRLLIKEKNNILKSLCSVNRTAFIDKGSNWIQMSGSLKPDLFYSDKLHLPVDTGRKWNVHITFRRRPGRPDSLKEVNTRAFLCLHSIKSMELVEKSEL